MRSTDTFGNVAIAAGAVAPLAVELLRRGGTLCGVFSGAAGILCGNAAVTLQRENIPSPCGVYVPALPRRSEAWPAGAQVSLVEGVLTVGSFLQVDMGAAEMWGGMALEARRPLSALERSSALEAVGRNLARYRREQGFSLLLPDLGWTEEGENSGGKVYYQMALPSIERLKQSAAQSDLQGIAQAHRGLVGLGPGLTPSGDDFLTGFWATLMLLSHEWPPWRFPPLVSELSGRTTAFGWSELWALGRGFCSEPLRAAISALGDVRRQDGALARLAAIGGTTGLDTLLGIGEALTLLGEPARRVCAAQGKARWL